MSNFNDDYKDVKARITFNKIKKRRKGKIVVVTVFCLFIASLGGAVTALVMNGESESENYYVQGNNNDQEPEVNTIIQRFKLPLKRYLNLLFRLLRLLQMISAQKRLMLE